MKKNLVSGIQSSGRLHLGNYFGAMRQNIALSNSGEFESFIFIADYHSMTSLTDAEARRKSSFDLACAYLACGLDVSKVTLFKQSNVPEHTELAWILSTVTPMAILELAHAYKDKTSKYGDSSFEEYNKSKEFAERMREEMTQVSLTNTLGVKRDNHSILNAGLFTYPVLMAADILMYKADVVPVGKDQIQHIEMTREIAGKFNRAYGTELFTMPKEYVMQDVAIVPGTDGQKMSKSYGNVIPLFGSDEEIKKAVMGIVTDSARPEDKKNPDENNVYKIHKLFLNEEEDKALRARYEEGGLSYKDAKESLLNAVLTFISPMREKYDYYQSHSEEVQTILKTGGEKARTHAQIMMQDVRSVVGL